MNTKSFFLTCSLVYIISLSSCERFIPPVPADNGILDGPVEGLAPQQTAQFIEGDEAFNDDIFTKDNGLGPLFVATSCGTCHAGDGKGHPFTTLTRFGQSDVSGNQFLHLGGPQLQNRALPGYTPEQIPAGAASAKFTPPAITGLGFLEMVPDADIIALTDPNDANVDGISGVAHWRSIPPYLRELPNHIEQNGKYICRFGKKAGAYNLLHQTVNAYNQDMGVNSVFEPVDVYSGLEVDPEVSNQTVNNVVFYLQTLKAPIQRNQNDRTVQLGKNLFIQTGCESCHKQTLRTGTAPVEVLSQKEFHPYTDLLLHDMGAGLDDGYTEGTALSSEWRTPPLWGLGLSPKSQGGVYFLLHDGRAHSIQDAINLHGGEAENSKNNFQNLSQSDKDALIEFLESL